MAEFTAVIKYEIKSSNYKRKVLDFWPNVINEGKHPVGASILVAYIREYQTWVTSIDNVMKGRACLYLMESRGQWMFYKRVNGHGEWAYGGDSEEECFCAACEYFIMKSVVPLDMT